MGQMKGRKSSPEPMQVQYLFPGSAAFEDTLQVHPASDELPGAFEDLIDSLASSSSGHRAESNVGRNDKINDRVSSDKTASLLMDSPTRLMAGTISQDLFSTRQVNEPQQFEADRREYT
jgi:hypothetical protein